MNAIFNINDKANIAGLPYRVYNIFDNGTVCFGRISAVDGKDLSAKNPHNILTLTAARVNDFLEIGSIVKA